MTCNRCRRQFYEGDKVEAKVLSIYHEVPVPHGNEFQYCIERPFAATSIRHLYCDPYNETSE